MFLRDRGQRVHLTDLARVVDGNEDASLGGYESTHARRIDIEIVSNIGEDRSSSRKRDGIGGAIVAQALVLGLALHEFLRCSGHDVGKERLHPPMSPVEMEILGALAAGLSDKQIAQRLLTTHHNVDYHLRSIRRKLGAANRSHLAYLAGRLSLA